MVNSHSKRRGRTLKGVTKMSGMEIVRRMEKAVRRGLDPVAARILLAELDDVTIRGTLGIDVREIMSEEITLVTLLHDGSYSMKGTEGALLRSYSELMAALAGARNADNILVSNWIFSTERRLIHGFMPVKDVDSRLFMSQYSTESGTALYDTILAAFTGQLDYSLRFWEDGGVSRNIVIVFSDGGDVSSVKDPDGRKVREASESLLQNGDFILAYVGFADGLQLDYQSVRKLAAKVGFPDVIASDKSSEGLDSIFGRVASSIVNASNPNSIVVRGKFFD